jgi:hypothetical protein
LKSGRTWRKHSSVRSAVAALLAAVLVALAWAPHVHDGPHGDHDCAACIARGAEPAGYQVPDLAPRPALREAPTPAPVLAIPAGAPLGAVPGQSPPVNA